MIGDDRRLFDQALSLSRVALIEYLKSRALLRLHGIQLRSFGRQESFATLVHPLLAKFGTTLPCRVTKFAFRNGGNQDFGVVPMR